MASRTSVLSSRHAHAEIFPNPTMPPSFRILEDIAVADVAFEAIGDTPSELFVAAAQAVMEMLANPMTISKIWYRTIDLEDEQFADLLCDWLSEMVYLKDAEG